MNDFLKYMIGYVLENESMHPLALVAKCNEEYGELSKDILKEHGYLRHKKYKPEMYDELADVFMTLFTVVAQTDVGIGDKTSKPTPEEIVNRFETALKKKFEVYKKLLENEEL